MVFRFLIESARKSKEKVIIYTLSTDIDKYADFTAINIQKHPDRVEYDVLKRDEGTVLSHVTVPIPGLFTVYNSLTAFIAAYIEGIDTDSICRGLADVFVPGKAEIVPTGRDFSVLIDYAHNPDSIANIIDTVKEYAKRTVILFGCGGDRDRTKRAVMGEIAARLADHVIITSDNSRGEDPMQIICQIVSGIPPQKAYTVIPDRASAIRYAIENAKAGDLILLAGKGHEEYEIDQNGKHEYSERKIVLDHVTRGRMDFRKKNNID